MGDEGTRRYGLLLMKLFFFFLTREDFFCDYRKHFAWVNAGSVGVLTACHTQIISLLAKLLQSSFSVVEE